MKLVSLSTCRIGSDEDDESATDESQSNEDPSETAVSIDARRIYDNTLPEPSDRQDGTPDSGTAQQVEGNPLVLSTDQNRDADQGASSGKIDEDQLNGDVSFIV